MTKTKKEKPKDLGNTQCDNCLCIFPVKGELPQDVNCPRCGREMRLEWKAGTPEAEKAAG